MKRYTEVRKDFDMRYWKGNGHISDPSTHFPTLHGLNGWELSSGSSHGDIYSFTLQTDKLEIDDDGDTYDKKTKDGDYFYSLVHTAPTVFKFLSTSEGGAIEYQGKNYWSGGQDEFSKSIGIPCSEIVIKNQVAYAIVFKEAITIVKKNFPGLIFSIDKKWNRFVVDFTRV